MHANLSISLVHELDKVYICLPIHEVCFCTGSSEQVWSATGDDVKQVSFKTTSSSPLFDRIMLRILTIMLCFHGDFVDSALP